MFDNTKNIISFPNNMKIDGTIHEYRAPTDDSIRLAEEYRDKIQQDFIGRVDINDNSFNIVCDIYNDPYIFGYELVFRYNLNGQEKIEKISIDKLKLHKLSKENDLLLKWIHENIYKLIVDKIAEQIAKSIIQSDFMKILEKRGYK